MGLISATQIICCVLGIYVYWPFVVCQVYWPTSELTHSVFVFRTTVAIAISIVALLFDHLWTGYLLLVVGLYNSTLYRSFTLKRFKLLANRVRKERDSDRMFYWWELHCLFVQAASLIDAFYAQL
ncbi:hypothetical protein OH492_11735 [Vibrio chagasii]|nr:hypothetical protein [Vibrio chagasii]